ncbi:MAG TPA: hypothetical protein VNH11_27565 [Pirellulales bacterium]|nr:hypothetical protein [Pirellulales bacterium]
MRPRAASGFPVYARAGPCFFAPIMPPKSSAFCQHCQRDTLHEQQTEELSHILHLLISLFLCGLWLPIWILMALGQSNRNARAPWVCQACGSVWFDPDAEAVAEARRERRRQQLRQAGRLAARGSLSASKATANAVTSLTAAGVEGGIRLARAAPKLPGSIDRGLRRAAGEGNTILHYFFRLLTVAVLCAAIAALVAAA